MAETSPSEILLIEDDAEIVDFIETELRFDLGVFNTPRRHRMAETDKAG